MIEKDSFDDVVILNVRGDIDHMEMVDIRNAISELIGDGQSKVIIGMKEVKHINYLGIGVLVERLKRLRSCGGDLKLCGMSGYLRNIFAVVGAVEIFESFDSLEEAMRSFGAGLNR